MGKRFLKTRDNHTTNTPCSYFFPLKRPLVHLKIIQYMIYFYISIKLSSKTCCKLPWMFRKCMILWQLKGWYNKDDVVAEWTEVKGDMCLDVHCYVSGPNPLLDLAAEFRYHIFSKELPLVSSSHTIPLSFRMNLSFITPPSPHTTRKPPASNGLSLVTYVHL